MGAGEGFFAGASCAQWLAAHYDEGMRMTGRRRRRRRVPQCAHRHLWRAPPRVLNEDDDDNDVEDDVEDDVEWPWEGR